MEDCYILDKYGAIKLHIFEEIDINYLSLECVINGKLRIEFMYYPYIVASNPEKYLKKIKIAKEAERVKIRYIKLSNNGNNTDEYPILFYKDDKYKNDVILCGYLMTKYEKERYNPITPLDYILYKLYGYSEDYICRYYVSKYINHKVQEILPKEVEMIMRDKEISAHNKYMAKYELIKKYDNFKDFDKMYEGIKKEAMKLLNKTKKSKDLEQYAKNVEINEFKFDMKNSIKNNPMYSFIKKMT